MFYTCHFNNNPLIYNSNFEIVSWNRSNCKYIHKKKKYHARNINYLTDNEISLGGTSKFLATASNSSESAPFQFSPPPRERHNDRDLRKGSMTPFGEGWIADGRIVDEFDSVHHGFEWATAIRIYLRIMPTTSILRNGRRISFARSRQLKGGRETADRVMQRS